MHILAHFATHHFADAHFNVDSFVVQPKENQQSHVIVSENTVQKSTDVKQRSAPAVELVGILLARVVEIETQVGVDADAEVVVHNENLRVILVGDGVRVGWES